MERKKELVSRFFNLEMAYIENRITPDLLRVKDGIEIQYIVLTKTSDIRKDPDYTHLVELFETEIKHG